jgi:hypothetical protein
MDLTIMLIEDIINERIRMTCFLPIIYRLSNEELAWYKFVIKTYYQTLYIHGCMEESLVMR